MELTATVTAIMAIMSFGFLAAVILGMMAVLASNRVGAGAPVVSSTAANDSAARSRSPWRWPNETVRCSAVESGLMT